MDVTFALRRKEMIRDKPAISQVVHRWPALFTESQVYCEFTRVVGKNLKEQFFDALDEFSPRLMDLFRKKKGLAGQLLADLLRQTKTGGEAGPASDRAIFAPIMDLFKREPFTTITPQPPDPLLFCHFIPKLPGIPPGRAGEVERGPRCISCEPDGAGAAAIPAKCSTSSTSSVKRCWAVKWLRITPSLESTRCKELRDAIGWNPDAPDGTPDVLSEWESRRIR
ncbi:uncharacterized protein [Hoplias malabaricus]|uniref:uncharacterized protein isoform X3 n=1 Tax=Hoplias malabaricus TaxID=27720 RepID=UPI003463332B